jgi:hypothetical protein
MPITAAEIDVAVSIAVCRQQFSHFSLQFPDHIAAIAAQSCATNDKRRREHPAALAIQCPLMGQRVTTEA